MLRVIHPARCGALTLCVFTVQTGFSSLLVGQTFKIRFHSPSDWSQRFCRGVVSIDRCYPEYCDSGLQSSILGDHVLSMLADAPAAAPGPKLYCKTPGSVRLKLDSTIS